VKTRQVTLKARPQGEPTEDDFELVEADLPDPGPGEVLVRATMCSVDPYQRGRMSEARSYAKSLELGDVITSQTVGEVAESNHPGFSPGDAVVGQLGWTEHAVVPAHHVRRIPPGVPPAAALHVLGATGLTAYFGLLDVGRPKPGDTVVVSGAAGAVGQLVGQIAKLMGCRTVGIAGGPEKVRDLTEEYGYDVGIDYKGEDVKAALKAACPDGVDVYFDNVGGEITDLVLQRLALHARVVVCGQISQYNNQQPELGPRNLATLIVHRARIEGFLVTDYAHRSEEALPRLARWLAEGKLTYREHVTEGIENAPRAFIGMLRGENRGKTLVKVS
jgi:NADPH-dependent curcumin reductase CurA